MYITSPHREEMMCIYNCFKATKMNGEVFGLRILPDQMQVYI